MYSRYDMEEYCGPTAWENCATSGWRKNLRDNNVTGVTPIPDIDEEVDEGCDGVDLNRNFNLNGAHPWEQLGLYSLGLAMLVKIMMFTMDQ